MRTTGTRPRMAGITPSSTTLSPWVRAVAWRPSLTVAAVATLGLVAAAAGGVAIWQRTDDVIAGLAPGLLAPAVVANAVTCHRAVQAHLTHGPGAVPDTLGTLTASDGVGLAVVALAGGAGSLSIVGGRGGAGVALLAIAVVTSCLVLLQRTERAFAVR